MSASPTSAFSWSDAALTALAPAIWGSTYIVTTEWLPPDRPLTAACLRVLPAGLMLLALGRRRPERGSWGRLFVLSALNIGLFQALLFVAAYRLPGGLAAVLGALQPLMVMGIAWSIEGYRPGWMAWSAGFVGVAGMAAMLLSPSSTWDLWGVTAALTGAASMATGTYLTRRWRTGLPLVSFTGWQLLLGGAMLAPVAVVVDAPLPPLDRSQVIAFAYLSLGGAVVAYALWFRGMARLPSVAVSSLGLLSPLTAVLLGWAVLGQALTGGAVAGLAMVLGSVLAVQWRGGGAGPPPATQTLGAGRGGGVAGRALVWGRVGAGPGGAAPGAPTPEP